MSYKDGLFPKTIVALLAEGVDRNFRAYFFYPKTARVALLAEGVDRNHLNADLLQAVLVALLAEGVDRNLRLHLVSFGGGGRPPRGGRG